MRARRHRAACSTTLAVTLAAMSAFSAPAAAQGAAAFPARPIKFIVPLPPGGSNDVLARTIAERLQPLWPQPVVVENRSGAGGNIATDAVAKSPGDAHTWLLAPNNVLVINPHVGRTPYDALRDFVPVMQLANIAFLLAVHPSVEAKTVQELVALARSRPNSLNYGSSGNGGPQHLGAEMLKHMTGIEMVHVPFKGAVPAITELLAGRIQVWIGATNTLVPHVQSGKLRALASAGSKRFATFPEVPTMAEAGVAGYALDIWLGLAVPAGVPADIVAKINTDVARALDTPELRTRFAPQGIDLTLTGPAEFGRLVREDHDRWGRLIRAAGIKGD